MLYIHCMLQAFPKKYIFEIVTVIYVRWGSLFTNTMDTQYTYTVQDPMVAIRGIWLKR